MSRDVRSTWEPTFARLVLSDSPKHAAQRPQGSLGLVAKHRRMPSDPILHLHSLCGWFPAFLHSIRDAKASKECEGAIDRDAALGIVCHPAVLLTNEPTDECKGKCLVVALASDRVDGLVAWISDDPLGNPCGDLLVRAGGPASVLEALPRSLWPRPDLALLFQPGALEPPTCLRCTPTGVQPSRCSPLLLRELTQSHNTVGAHDSHLAGAEVRRRRDLIEVAVHGDAPVRNGNAHSCPHWDEAQPNLPSS